MKKKALGAYNKQYKQRCHKCSKYGHKPGDQNCPENKKEKKNDDKTKKMTIKRNILMVMLSLW